MNLVYVVVVAAIAPDERNVWSRENKPARVFALVASPTVMPSSPATSKPVLKVARAIRSGLLISAALTSSTRATLVSSGVSWKLVRNDPLSVMSVLLPSGSEILSLRLPPSLKTVALTLAVVSVALALMLAASLSSVSPVA